MKSDENGASIPQFFIADSVAYILLQSFLETPSLFLFVSFAPSWFKRDERCSVDSSSTVALRRYGAALAMALGLVIPMISVAPSVVAADTVTIMQVQGSGDVSPLVGQTVTTSGVVTASQQEKPTQGTGFYLQDANGDDDPATSDGVFVFEGKNHPVTVRAGDLVTVTGKVTEFRGLTEITVTPSATTVQVTGHTETLPAPVALNPPMKTADGLRSLEALEGMVVRMPDGAPVVGPTNQFHEFTVVNPALGVSRVFQKDAETTGVGAIVEVGDQGGFSVNVKVGDTVSGIVGPLSYAFGVYRVDPTQALIVTPGPDNAQPVGANVGVDEFTLGAFNIENFFDPVLGPGDDKDSTPSQALYKKRLAKASTAIATQLNAPTLLGIEEAENLTVLNDILAQPALASVPYRAVQLPGLDPRGINVALLYRTDRASVVGDPVTFNECVTLNDKAYPPRDNPYGAQDYCTTPDGKAGNWLFPRPPLVVHLAVRRADGAGGSQPLVVIVNHLKSKTGSDPENNNYTTRRTREAEALARYVDGLVQGGDANVAVVGDLNDFPGTPPLDALTKGRTPGSTLRAVVTEANPPYTYVFSGQSEILDHILLTSGLATSFTGIEVGHFDADYPEELSKDGTKPNRLSDHDPPLARFKGTFGGTPSVVMPATGHPSGPSSQTAGPWYVPTDNPPDAVPNASLVTLVGCLSC